MTQIPQPNSASQKDERQLLSKYFREFTGVYTQASRTAIPDEYCYNLENIIPVGPQNAHVVPNILGPLWNYGADTIYASQGVNLNGTEYLVNFSTTGKVFLYNISTQTSQQLAGPPLAGVNSQCAQWKNTNILFIDSTGYYEYDGTTFALISGPGVPASGNSIAVYAGRVWIVQGRTIFFSGANDFSAPSWTVANGAGFVSLTDPTIRASVTKLIAANGYLYIFSSSGINAISDVYVPQGANPPTPVFTNQNLQALIGSSNPNSVIPYDRNIMFASQYGIHTLLGVDAPKVSTDIDGTWQYLDISQAISAGQVVVQNILCGAFLIKRLNDPIFGSNPIVVLWFSRDDTNQNSGVIETTDVWWFANYGALTFIVSGLLNNVPALFGFIGNQLYQLFGDPTTAPHVEVWGKLYPMEDELARKQVMQVGVEADYSLYGTQLNLFVDTPNTSNDARLQLNVSAGQWVNAAGIVGQWVNAAGQVGGWVGQGLYLISGIAPPAMDRHVGLRLTSTGYNYELHLLAMDYKMLDRWQ
jgi:hypothetical protein